MAVTSQSSVGWMPSTYGPSSACCLLLVVGGGSLAAFLAVLRCARETAVCQSPPVSASAGSPEAQDAGKSECGASSRVSLDERRRLPVVDEELYASRAHRRPWVWSLGVLG
uniref:Uncharacterized protein n=1 Tax=Ixodes ricinus TaxID=34613 RepID=A0A6B0UJP1_IXORI